MPWHQEPKKDGTNTDMPRGVVSRLRSGDFRMGQPAVRNGAAPVSESIGHKRQTRGTETSQYPVEKKANAISRVAASETEAAQTGKLSFPGLEDTPLELSRNVLDESIWNDQPQKVRAL